MAKVTIIAPCYNQAEFLDECLQSVILQTYENWECLMINDGSTDTTEEICKNWAEKDARFIYFYQENKEQNEKIIKLYEARLQDKERLIVQL